MIYRVIEAGDVRINICYSWWEFPFDEFYPPRSLRLLFPLCFSISFFLGLLFIRPLNLFFRLYFQLILNILPDTIRFELGFEKMGWKNLFVFWVIITLVAIKIVIWHSIQYGIFFSLKFWPWTGIIDRNSDNLGWFKVNDLIILKYLYNNHIIAETQISQSCGNITQFSNER